MRRSPNKGQTRSRSIVQRYERGVERYGLAMSRWPLRYLDGLNGQSWDWSIGVATICTSSSYVMRPGEVVRSSTQGTRYRSRRSRYPTHIASRVVASALNQDRAPG